VRGGPRAKASLRSPRGAGRARRRAAAWTSVERGVEHAAVEAEAAVETLLGTAGDCSCCLRRADSCCNRSAGQPARADATRVFPVTAGRRALARTNRHSLAVLNERLRVRRAGDHGGRCDGTITRRPRASRRHPRRSPSWLSSPRAASFRDGGAQVTEAAGHASRERVTALPIRRLAVPMPAFVTSVAQRAGRPVRRAN
jgi:hypothetical protein